MKKLFILGITLSLFISCAKEDNAGIPPVNQGQIPSQKQLTTLEADKATVADYVAGKKAKIHGKIVKDGNFSYFKFSDGTLVQIYAATDVVNALPQEKKTKLNTAGQEITVTGTFKDYTLKSSGKVIKELVYENENDLVFGQEGSTTPGEITTLEAATATASDYIAGKKVKLHGTVAEVQGNKSFFKFSDGTLVQIFTPKFKELSQETNNKLKTVGQEITVTGTFTDFTKNGVTVKEIVYESESDLVFGAVSNNPQPQQPTDVLEAATATANDYVAGKDVKIHGTIVRDGNHSYFKFSDNTMVQIYVVKSVFDLLSQEDKTKFATTGQEVTVTGKFKDFKPKNSTNVVKEIECTSKDNLVFGAASNNPQPQPQPSGVLEADNATVSDFIVGKEVKLHGSIVRKDNRSYFKFKDDTLIQFYVPGYGKLPKNVRTRLETEGQKVTVSGTFSEHNSTRQIAFKKAEDLAFEN